MKAFFASLSHSTKITFITCGCFILLTMLILIFLMLCPIQETDSTNSNDALIVTGTTAATTIASEETTISTQKTTVTRTTTTTAATSAEVYQNWGYVDTDSYSDDGYDNNNYDNYDDGYVDPDNDAGYVYETEAVYEDATVEIDPYEAEAQTFTEPVAAQTEAAVTDVPSYLDGLTDGGIAED